MYERHNAEWNQDMATPKPPSPSTQAHVEDDRPTFEDVAETLVVHLGRTVEDVAALPKTGGKVLRCFGLPRARWACRGTPHLQMQRLTFESTTGRRDQVSESQSRNKLSFYYHHVM